MGFFSAVKKIFGKKPEAMPSAAAKAPADASQGPGSAQAAASAEPGVGVKTAAPQAASQPTCPGQEHGHTQAQEKLKSISPQPSGHPQGAESLGEESAGAAAMGADDAPAQAMPEAEAGMGAGPEPLVAQGGVDDELLLALRQAEPRLSSWLGVILAGQVEVNDEFWRRLRFLLTSLEAPSGEIEAFLDDFERWLARMEYTRVDEFRSELQYRLALALDLEDEEDERNRLLLKLGQGLAATRMRLGRRLERLFSAHSHIDDAFWEEMEELFITADMGYETSMEIVERLKRRAHEARVEDPAQVGELLREELKDIFRRQPRIRTANKPEVALMMGVNGAGKTTTIAKLAYRDRLNGKKVLVVAADTFRAAAIEQLQVWADRAGAEFYRKPEGADPAAVAWEGLEFALKNDIDVVYIDTAGRLQTRVNLMEELGKIRQVIAKKHPGAPHRSILVLDATTGQNSLSQARLFKDGGADEIILTKLDGTAKGGVAIAVAMREQLPISYIGLGEKMEDLRPFDGADFAGAILDQERQA